MKLPFMSSALTLAIAPLVVALSPANAKAATWQRILTCDAGKSWIDVDMSERRNLQLVVRNPEAVRYLVNMGAVPGSRNADARELIFQVSQEKGVFTPSDFSIATDHKSYDGVRAKKIGDDYMTKFTTHTYVFRDGAGVKVEFVLSGLEICNYYDARNESCIDGRTHSVRDRYLANWYFPDCR